MVEQGRGAAEEVEAGCFGLSTRSVWFDVANLLPLLPPPLLLP